MPKPPELFVFFGLIATGKSTLAQVWAKARSMEYYNSDRVRKELAGLAAECSRKESLGQGIYSKEFSRKTYTALLEKAEENLLNGRSVVLDGSYQEINERDRIRAMARRYRASVCFVLCQCPESVLKERLVMRAKDPKAVSDGRWEIFLEQKKRFSPPDELEETELLVFSTEGEVDGLVNELTHKLEEKIGKRSPAPHLHPF